MTQKVNYPLDVHNTYWLGYDDISGQDRASRSKVHPFMVPLIQELQRKRPTWEFHAGTNGNINHSGDVNEVLHTDFEIYDNGELLASITKEFRGSGYIYSVKNHRLAAARKRGVWTNRKHLKDMVPLILKQVYPRTASEIAEEKYKNSRSSVQALNYKAGNAYRVCLTSLAEPALDFITPHWDKFLEAASPSNISEKKQNFHFLRDESRAAHALVMGPHWLIVERPRDVVVKQGADKEAYTSTLESLPNPVKMAMGLLKMTEPDTVVDGVGVRTSADTFYIAYSTEE